MEGVGKFSNFVLHSYWRSSCSWRVRIVLNMKKINYQLKPINLLKAEHKTEEYLQINPIGKVPNLQFSNGNGEIINLAESMAICEFLEELSSDVKLLPEDSISKAKVRALCCEIACNIQPIQNLPVMNRVQELGGDKIEWAKEWISKGLVIVEKIISTTRGKYSFGDNVTLIDAFLVPQLYNARRFNVDLSCYPNLVEIDKSLNTLEAFITAHPDNQPDFEANK